MGNSSFILYDTDLKSMDFLTDAQIGKLFRAIKAYRLEGKTIDLGKNPALNMLYNQIMEHITMNEEKYKAIRQKNSESARKRWHQTQTDSSFDSMPTHASAYEGTKNNARACLNDNDNDNDNDNENENDNESVALGVKRETKRKNYSGRKPDFYSEGEPTYDIEAFTKKAIGIKYEKKEKMNC